MEDESVIWEYLKTSEGRRYQLMFILSGCPQLSVIDRVGVLFNEPTAVYNSVT